jgi:hypothetical protein
MHSNSQTKQVRPLVRCRHDDVQPRMAHAVATQLLALSYLVSQVREPRQAWAHLDLQQACL